MGFSICEIKTYDNNTKNRKGELELYYYKVIIIPCVKWFIILFEQRL